MNNNLFIEATNDPFGLYKVAAKQNKGNTKPKGDTKTKGGNKGTGNPTTQQPTTGTTPTGNPPTQQPTPGTTPTGNPTPGTGAPTPQRAPFSGGLRGAIKNGVSTVYHGAAHIVKKKVDPIYRNADLAGQAMANAAYIERLNESYKNLAAAQGTEYGAKARGVREIGSEAFKSALNGGASFEEAKKFSENIAAGLPGQEDQRGTFGRATNFVSNHPIMTLGGLYGAKKLLVDDDDDDDRRH